MLSSQDEYPDDAGDELDNESLCPFCRYPLEGDGSHICPDTEDQELLAADPTDDDNRESPAPSSNQTGATPAPSPQEPADTSTPWDAVLDPDQLLRVETCPKCAAPPGEPCHSIQDWGTPYWPDGYVHSGREVVCSHAAWLREVAATHGPAALLEACPHPSCGAGPGQSCAHVDQGRLALAPPAPRSPAPRATSPAPF